MWEAIQSNKRKSLALIVVLVLVLVALGYAIGGAFDAKNGPPFGILTAVGIWVIMMAVSFAGGEKILLATAGAREVTHDEAPQLFNIVEEMKIASGLPALPKVYVIQTDAPNAFAVGLKPERSAVAVTTGLMARLNRDELQGVVAHEIGHIVNRDTMFMTLAGVTVGAVIILSDVFLRGMWYSGGRRSRSSKGGQAGAILAVIAVVLAILAPLLAQILYFACSRRREYLADASGAQFTRYPEGLASALEKIAGGAARPLQVSRAVAPMFTVNPLAAAGSARNLFSTHPPTADRVRVLRGMGGSSLAAYEKAYEALHANQRIVGARSLQETKEAGVRSASAETPASTADRWRSAKDVLHRANQMAVLACPCGLRIKLPPAFDQKSVTCPRCGRQHDASAALAMTAAAAVALDAAGRDKPMRPVYPS